MALWLAPLLNEDLDVRMVCSAGILVSDLFCLNTLMCSNDTGLYIYIHTYIYIYIYDKICYTYQRGSIWPMQHHPLPASGSCTWPLPLLTYHFTSGPASVDSPFHGKKRVEKWNFHGNKTPGRNHVMDDGPGFFWQIVPLATQLLNDLNVYYSKSLLWKPWPVWSDGLLLNNRGCSSIPERT